MEISDSILLAVAAGLTLLFLSYVFWRYFWFFRNPTRQIPQGERITSPADGTVVYVKRLEAREPVISIKRDRKISINEIVNEELEKTRVLIGVFMSPFDVHYNRAPLSGVVDYVRHYPARLKNRHMTSMHWRSLLKRFPIYEKSPHILENERTVTRITGDFQGEPICCHVVQIAGGSVKGIESKVHPGAQITRGEVFGMIRIGSQVDVTFPWRPPMKIRVEPGEKVRAGESILAE
jgi:phosphatidylserine decarboxylase